MCNELVGTGDVDRDAGACLGAGNRGDGAVGKALGLKGAVDGLVRGGWCGRRVAEGPRLFGGDGPLEGLGRGLVRVWGCRRGRVGQPSGGGVGVEDELLNGHDLLSIAELLELAEEGLDLVNQGFTFSVLELTEYFLCEGLAADIN